MLTVCFSAKGGQGCSTITAMLALLHPPVTVVDTAGDLPALLGIGEQHGAGLTDVLADTRPIDLTALSQCTVEVAPGVDVVFRGATSPEQISTERWHQLADVLKGPNHVQWLIDAGTTAHALATQADKAYLVTRPCYLALRRAVSTVARPTGIILLREPGRALGRSDVERIIGAPVITDVEIDPAVARAVDAGLLSSRTLPRSASRALRDPARAG
jgi:hypothetical protein